MNRAESSTKPPPHVTGAGAVETPIIHPRADPTTGSSMHPRAITYQQLSRY